MAEPTHGQAQNTNRELWREKHPEGDAYSYYAPSIHVTEGGGIGINVDGTVHVKTLREWHKLGDNEAPDLRPNVWDLIRDDPELKRARQRLSIHEIRRIITPQMIEAGLEALSEVLGHPELGRSTLEESDREAVELVFCRMLSWGIIGLGSSERSRLAVLASKLDPAF